MALDPRVIIAVHPTRGLDVAATQQVQEWLIASARTRNASVLLISEDLDEVLHMSDRVAVLYEGQIVGCVAARTADRGQIGLMMAGAA
jgi:simple sugar transport system ATP-binding protein